MIIEKGSSDNLLEVARLFNQYRIFYGKNSNIDLAVEFISARVKNSESVIFLAKNDENTAIGFTQLYPAFSSVSAQKSWILNDLFVDKGARGQGVAKALMNAAKALAAESGAKGLGLQTAVDNLAAQKLYESLGYQRDVEFYSYYLSI